MERSARSTTVLTAQSTDTLYPEHITRLVFQKTPTTIDDPIALESFRVLDRIEEDMALNEAYLGMKALQNVEDARDDGIAYLPTSRRQAKYHRHVESTTVPTIEVVEQSEAEPEGPKPQWGPRQAWRQRSRQTLEVGCSL